MEQELGRIERKQALLRDDRKLWRVMNSYILYLKEILLYGIIIILVIIIPFVLILPLESLVLMIILAGDWCIFHCWFQISHKTYSFKGRINIWSNHNFSQCKCILYIMEYLLWMMLLYQKHFFLNYWEWPWELFGGEREKGQWEGLQGMLPFP